VGGETETVELGIGATCDPTAAPASVAVLKSNTLAWCARAVPVSSVSANLRAEATEKLKAEPNQLSRGKGVVEDEEGTECVCGECEDPTSGLEWTVRLVMADEVHSRNLRPRSFGGRLVLPLLLASCLARVCVLFVSPPSSFVRLLSLPMCVPFSRLTPNVSRNFC
jgi:hypothetical protein